MIPSRAKANKRSWSLEEDKLLLKLTETHGTVGNWPTIALEMEHRSGKQCRERYINQLDPSIKKTEWTIEEDSIIKRLHLEIGKKWSKYMEHLPGRSDNAIKNRYHVISRDNFAEHNLQQAASLSIVVTAPESGEFVPETAAVRLDRFRCARDLLDRKIRALEREREQLVDHAVKEEGEGEGGKGLAIVGQKKPSGSFDRREEDQDEECSVGANSIGATTVDAFTVDAGADECTAFSLRDKDNHTFSTALDEFHFDCEDMCYDPTGTYDPFKLN